MPLRQKERSGDKPKESSDSLTRKAVELDGRLRQRLAVLDREALMSTKPPQILTAALILPARYLGGVTLQLGTGETANERRRGIDAVLDRERRLGRSPIEQGHNGSGFDVLSTESSGDTIRIEIAVSHSGTEDFYLTHNEVITGKNAYPRSRLALVKLDQRGPQLDDVRYLDDPFTAVDLGDFGTTGIRLNWTRLWGRGRAPF